ncbi:hypothetical protein BGZ65_004474 [Modicella reniformis]|uniref:Rho-GAP domain-containing protein n=1 Tax=Modicella reniformis TaxID=1440133 RepID=A0A9P6LTU7_9FUNG|nr:hypothetical protein BGZ65_004474 [Modicella reniformis]
MVVICACNLPDPNVVDYDPILRVVLDQLEEFVENDYTVVMFSGGARYRPGWKWLFMAYRSLGRRYKKNLKALYIVHPSTWPRLILGTMNAIISPKFGAKVHYIDNLSHLARVVPLNQINIPPAVYQHNLQFESSITLPENQQDDATRIFGAPLERLMGPNGEKGLPKFVQDCISNLIQKGLYVEGLFRRSPSSAMLKQVRAAYDRGSPVNLAEFDIHISAQGDDKTSIVEFIKKEIISQVSHNNLVLMMEVFRLLKMVADMHGFNKMTAFNLAVVMSPNMVRHEDVMQEIAMSAVSSREKEFAMEEMLTLGTVVRIIIECYDEVF